MTSPRVLATSDSEPRSSFTIEGGFARVNPVPVVSHPARWKAFTTCLPSRPVAPVIRAVFAIMCWRLSDESGSCEVGDLELEPHSQHAGLYEINKLGASNHVHVRHSSRSQSKIGNSTISRSFNSVVSMCCRRREVLQRLKILLHGNPKGLFAMKKKISSEKFEFQRFPTRPRPSRSGHGYSFQLAKTQSRTNPH